MAVRQEPLQEIVSANEPSRFRVVAAGLWRFARHQPLGALSGIITIATFLLAVGAWWGIIVPHDPEVFHGADRLKGLWSTSADGERLYVLGTDDIGRDMLSRLIKGAQLSIFFGLAIAAVSTVIGGVIGLTSAYVGGKTDLIVQRVVDAVQVIPFLVLAIAIVSILGPSIRNGFIAVMILAIPRPARVIRSSVLAAKETAWVEAARSLGASDKRIMFRHILPNVIAPMIVVSTYTLAVAIIVEASLSFLGIGAQPPTPSWGAMLTGSGAVYFETNPRLALLPGFSISIIVFATNMFGDAVRDVLDPRLRGSR